MDYIEAFSNLRTNNKWGRKSPHKAVLLLTVIEMFEENILTDNEIFYNDELKRMFLKVWNKALPQEPLFHPDAYLPFWYLQNDSFWHIVPKRGHEDILTMLRDTNIKPSEAKLNNSVNYVELDEELYFMMTLPSSRRSLKRVLLENYTNLSEAAIERMSESNHNIVDHSVAAIADYQEIMSAGKAMEREVSGEADGALKTQFASLSDDVQIALNVEYYRYLKNHRNERETFWEICPTVYELYNRIVNQPLRRDEVSPSFAFNFENFLADLKIALMSEDGAWELVDKIQEAIDCLREVSQEDLEDALPEEESDNAETTAAFTDDSNMKPEIADVEPKSSDADFIPERGFVKESRRGKPWTENEEELITLYFQMGRTPAAIAEVVGRTEVSIKMRLAKLGLMEYTYGQDDEADVNDGQETVAGESDFRIENSFVRCVIYDRNGAKIFSSEGKLKYIHGLLYRLNLKRECFTVKAMSLENGRWIKGRKKIVAYPRTDLYRVMDDATDYADVCEDIVESPVFEDCKLKVNGVWYDYSGNRADEPLEIEPIYRSGMSETESNFIPKGKLKDIADVAEASYDFLWAMAVVEFMQMKPQPSVISYDRMACMEIAIAWELLSEEETVREKEGALTECIEHLIKESYEEMDEPLDWGMDRKKVFNAIKDYPMAGAFEDMVDELLAKSPCNVLRAWFADENDNEVIGHSAAFEKSCLYAIHPNKRDPYIELNKGWQKYLFFEHEKLMEYFRTKYIERMEQN